MGYRAFCAVQRARHRALGHDLHPDRLLRVAEPGHGREDRQQGADLVRVLRRPRGRVDRCCSASCASAENRKRVVEEMERRRYLRPLLATGRRLRPQARFLWQRLTPGGLGLELTTLMAVLAVGLFVLIAYWSIIGGDPGPTPGDQTALDVAEDLSNGWLDAVAKAVTDFGSLFVVGPIRRRRRPSAHLASGAGPSWAVSGALGMARSSRGTRSRPGPTGRGRPAAWSNVSGLVLPQRARRLRDDLHLAGVDRGVPRLVPGHHQARPPDRGGDRGGRADRPDPRLSAGALAERRHRRLGPRASPRFAAAAAMRFSVAHPRQSAAVMTDRLTRLDRAPAGARELSTTLFGAAGVLSLAAFGGLILAARAGLLRPSLGEVRRGVPLAVRARRPGAGRA